MSSDQTSDVPGPIPSILAEVDDKTFEQEDWNVVIRECASLAARWKHLSGFIGLPSTVIDQIQCDHPNDSSSCWNEALNQWIKQNYNIGKFGKPSWKTLLGAIEHIDRCLFEKLASEHKNHGSSSVASEHQSQIRVDEDNLTDDGDLVEKDSSKEQEEPSKVVAKRNILDDCIVGNHQLTFPCLDVKEMSKEKQKELHQRLYIESVEMMEKFQSLLSEVTKSLKRRAVSKNSILCHLMGLGQLRPVYEDPPLPVFRRQLHDLKKAKDVDEVMLGIGDYCSFFNFQLIEQIVLKLGTDHDRDKLAKYKQDFHAYAMRKVFECPSEVSSTNSNGLIKLYITLDDTYDNCTVSHLQLFIGKLQKILNIPSVLILHRIESGSIKLTFLLLYDQYLHVTFPLSKEQTEALLCEGVIYFSCEDHNFSKLHVCSPGLVMHPMTMQLSSLLTQETQQSLLKEQTEYPKQKLLHQLNPDYLTVGEDGCYYKIRDYNLNETDLLGSGGFGSCLWAQDNTTTKMFAIKQNKNESFKSIEDECHVLSHLADNDYIIKFLGAVIDEGELPTQPPLVCKMMMELAENGNLSEMLKDEYGEEAPLPQDQSLYYLQQILEGVNFLHQSGYLHLDINTENVLVFDGGRTTKLTDFGTAVAVGEVTSMQGLKGLTPYFAAPEVIKGEVPKVSADIWSVLCILIEMLTARYPGHHHVGTNEVAMMFLIGSYVDININHLVPLDRLDVDPEVKQLFIDVLQVDPLSRPTAMELLNRPIISSAVDYGHYFDECYDSEDTEDLEASPAVECDDSIPIADVPQHISLSSSSGDQSLSLHSLGDKVSELPQFPGSNQQLHPDRGSQDSGVMESIVGSSTCTVFEQRLSHQDSGLEDSLAAIAGECSQAGVCIPVHHMDMHIAASVNPYSRQRSSSINKFGGFPSLAFSSLPQQPSPVPDYITVQRSYSFGGRSSSTKRSDSGFRPQNRATSGLNHVAKRHRPNSIHPKKLQRSYSAPSIQEAAYTEVDRVNPMGRPQLRRTSSEVYVDRGPDIDTPEKEKNRMQNLLSGLSLGPTHPPRSSAPIPARRQMSDASIKCDAQSATSSLSGSSTTSNELSDPWPWKQFDDSGNKDESTPPTNESQAFQRIC